MSDQHHAGAMGCAGHPDVKTPHLDRIAARGVRYDRAYCNNPICSPSRITFMLGQYMHTHRMFGNYHAEWPDSNADTLACRLRQHGYQTALVGKSHMVRRWDEDGFEFIRYTDLCDATRDDPHSCHYFQYLDDRGLADQYEEGVPGAGHLYARDGSGLALLPYEHSIERYTGDQTLAFLRDRDARRPFMVQMSFQRPHEPITPAAEHFDLYDPAALTLPDSSADYFENRFAGKPQFMQRYMEKGGLYPLADPNPDRLRRCLASYYALITAIDSEIGRVLDHLEASGELDNTIVLYHADHGDFAGDHGIFHKNFGIYESIHRIPWLLSWPGGPRGQGLDQIVESVDWYATCCGLCDVPMPAGREGADITADDFTGKEQAWCEWDWGAMGKISAIRTVTHRLVFYGGTGEGELYDHQDDPGEIHNRWDDPKYAPVRRDLTERLFRFTLQYEPHTDMQRDRRLIGQQKYAPTNLIHKRQRWWSELKEAYEHDTTWPPPSANSPGS